MSDQPSTTTVRIDTELVGMARFVCTRRKGRGGNQLKLVDYLDSIVRAQITADYREERRLIAQEEANAQAGKETAPSAKPRRKKAEE